MKISFFILAFINFLVDACDENDYISCTDELKEWGSNAGMFFPNGKEILKHLGGNKESRIIRDTEFLQVGGPVKKAPEKSQNIQFSQEECKEDPYCKTIGTDGGNGVCQKPSEPCDGDQLLGHCEVNSECVCCAKWNCTAPYFKCKVYTDPNGSYEHMCISQYSVCDGFDDCHHGDDEKHCNCKPLKKCKKAKGDCIRLDDQLQCTGRLIKNACKPKSGCQRTHVCCAPCNKPKGKCKRKGGTCMGENMFCNGQIISEGCKGCKCCIAWSYTGNFGPEKWSKVYPGCSGGDQSPINLGLDVDEINLTDINFNNYNDFISLSATVTDNQMFYANFDGIDNYNLTIQGGGIEGMSYLAGFKLTWGSDSSTGSEHTINDKRYPMEMQLFHLLWPQFNILSILFEISDTDNQALEPMIQAASVLSDQEGPIKNATIESLQLSRLLPSNTQKFYRYQGSITYPPCKKDYFDVQWTVFTHTSTVSENQLNILRSIKMGGKSISNNFRPLQPINGRPIFFNK